jgi:hypothetical protein
VRETIGALTKIAAPAAVEACRMAKLSDAGRALLRPGAVTAEFLAALLAADLGRDAVSLMAYALPKREAVWWACLAARSITGADAPPAVVAALEAAEAWVYEPTEERRRTAMERAQATDFDQPGAWAAVAAFWSGGSMAPPGLPEVPPPDHLTGLAVDGAVALAAVVKEPERAPEHLRRFLRQAIDIANGGSGRLRAEG